jgi:hypothetical protein
VWKLRVESTKLAGLIGFKGFIGLFVVGKSWFTRGAFFLWSNWCGNSQKKAVFSKRTIVLFLLRIKLHILPMNLSAGKVFDKFLSYIYLFTNFHTKSACKTCMYLIIMDQFNFTKKMKATLK